VVERHGLELEWSRLPQQVVPGDRVRHAPLRDRIEIREDNGRLDRRQRRADRGQLGPSIDRLVAVPVAIDGEEDAGLDLGEPVDNGSNAELGRA
jgi:hypothetical protein